MLPYTDHILPLTWSWSVYFMVSKRAVVSKILPPLWQRQTSDYPGEFGIVMTDNIRDYSDIVLDADSNVSARVN